MTDVEGEADIKASAAISVDDPKLPLEGQAML
jgi:hypothetical protein